MSNPKLFISYSWSNPEHEAWVLRLGTELRDSGVNVLLDKWDLKEGNDANAFMEKMVSDDTVKKVILVMDEAYRQKADGRKGGVGTETQIISAEVYESVEQSKFVAVIASRQDDGKAPLPTFYKSRIYIDLSDEDSYGKNFEKLLRWVYDKPLNVKPALGRKPAFLDETQPASTGTSVQAKRLIDSVRSSRPNVHGVMTEYFTKFSEGLENFRIASQDVDNFDDVFVESIEQFIPARNELIQVFSILSQYEVDSAGPLHKFFESLIPYLDKPESLTGTYREWDWDNLKFIVQECFLLCVAILLKNFSFDVLTKFLHEQYFVRKPHGQDKMSSFGIFRNFLKVLEYRKSRLKLNRLSVHADLLKERCTDSGVSFEHVMQADFILYLIDAINSINENRRQEWYPGTLVFKAYYDKKTFEVFLRAESSKYFQTLAPVLGVQRKGDFDKLVEGFRSQKLHIPRWDFDVIRPLELMNYNQLATKA